MNKKEILDVLSHHLKGEAHPEELLRVFTAALDGVNEAAERKEYQLIEETIRQAARDAGVEEENLTLYGVFHSALKERERCLAQCKEMTEDMEQIEATSKKLLAEVEKLERLQRESSPLVKFMSELMVETPFGDGKIIDIAEMLWAGKQAGSQPCGKEHEDDDECQCPSCVSTRNLKETKK